MAIIGLPGTIFTPAEGTNLPGIAFGHGWINSVKRYENLLTHLASWGIVVGAPDTETGPLASDKGLATDLSCALDVISEVRLGTGSITVQREKLGIVGHGFGAAAAAIASSPASATSSKVKVLAALFPAPGNDDGLATAATVSAPSLILADELTSMTSNALNLRRTLNSSDCVLRLTEKASGAGLAEGRTIRSALGYSKPDRGTHKLIRAFLTGYLLHQLAGEKKYAAFSDASTEFPGMKVIDPEGVTDDELDNFSRLLRK